MISDIKYPEVCFEFAKIKMYNVKNRLRYTRERSCEGQSLSPDVGMQLLYSKYVRLLICKEALVFSQARKINDNLMKTKMKENVWQLYKTTFSHNLFDDDGENSKSMSKKTLLIRYRKYILTNGTPPKTVVFKALPGYVRANAAAGLIRTPRGSNSRNSGSRRTSGRPARAGSSWERTDHPRRTRRSSDGSRT